MTFDNRLADVLDAATAVVPAERLAAPLPGIHRRIRRQRAVTAVAVGGVVAALVTGFVLARPSVERAAPPVAPISTIPDLRMRVAWETALVARNGRTLTVYAGPRGECQDLIDGTAVVTRQDGGQVTIAVRAWIVPAADCSTSGWVVGLPVELGRPLADREVRDADTGEARPTYHESHLPDLRNDARWSPIPSVKWSAPDQSWHTGYNGPNGWTLRIDGEPGNTAGPGNLSERFQLGSRNGIIERLSLTWAVRWSVGDVTYELTIDPAEGGQITRQQFEAEVNRLDWP